MSLEGRYDEELPQGDLSKLGTAGLELLCSVWALLTFLRRAEHQAKVDAEDPEQECAVCIDEVLRHGNEMEGEVKLATALAWAAQYILVRITVHPNDDPEIPQYFVELTDLGRELPQPAHIVAVDDNKVN